MPCGVAPRETVVLGLGNPLLSDDGVGLRTADLLHRLLQAEPIESVTVLTSARGGLELIDLLAGARRAIIVDCLTVPDPQPGRLRRLSLQDVAGSARLVGAHEVGVAAAFDLAAELRIPMPETVEIYGVEGGETACFSERLTLPVEAAAATLAQDLHRALKESRKRESGIANQENAAGAPEPAIPDC
jgi:hydrogenase maturation protease